MNKQVSTIRAEIDRRYEENREKARYDNYYRGMNDGLDHLEQFIDSLPEEHLIDGNKMIEPSKDLEAEIDKQIDKCWNDYATTGGFNWKGFARHFYELGQASLPMPEDTVLFQNGVEEGKRLMLEDAIKCYVYESENPCSESLDECLHSFSALYSHKGKQPYPLAGQYIKLIIVEEEK